MELNKEQLALLRQALDTASDVLGDEVSEITLSKGLKNEAIRQRERELRLRVDGIRQLRDYIDNSRDIDTRFEPRGFSW